jgi:hypothetical protein
MSENYGGVDREIQEFDDLVAAYRATGYYTLAEAGRMARYEMSIRREIEADKLR